NLGDALAAETGFKIEMIPLPMKRMGPELISGNISFICYTLEAWLPSVKEQVLWSDVIFNNQNLLVSLGAKPITSLKDLDKKRVGVVVNFYYPNLEDSFNKYQIFRENGPNNESNLQKLLHGRVDYVVLSSLEYQYQKKLQPRLNAYDLGIDTFGVKCAVSKKSPLSVSKINQAIAAMKKSGKLDRIFRLP
ncbi:MAG: transporter substrate-binding domain-containing protein, partial [Bdellovibrionaceae bacterium]|nr:transporter substrate-binding domain-containing protein [Pseudobdellovibrionaceae bacterium]